MYTMFKKPGYSFMYKNTGLKTRLQDRWSWATYVKEGMGMHFCSMLASKEELWPLPLTTREKGQFSKHLCLFGCVNDIVFKRSLGCGSEALQRFRSFLDSVGRHISCESHSLKRQVSLNTCNAADQRSRLRIQHPGCSRPTLLVNTRNHLVGAFKS